MPAIAVERRESREGSYTEQTLLYRITGAYGDDDDKQVFDAVADAAPMKHRGLKRVDEEIEIEPQGNGLWFAEVPYKAQEVEWKPGEGEGGSDEYRGPELSWDTTGGTHHIEHSDNTTRAYGSENLDFDGAIGVNNGQVAGVDVIVPKLEFTETHYLVNGRVTFDYVNTLHSLTGTVNKAGFRGFEAGEVLFMGARGTHPEPHYWAVEFQFAVSKTKRGITIGDCEVGVKKGWQYLWVHYRETKDTDGKATVRPKPVAVFVEDVYEEADFTQLGISQPTLGASLDPPEVETE